MGCFPCSTKKKQYKKRKNEGTKYRGVEIPAEVSSDLSKVSSNSFVKDESQVMSHSTGESDVTETNSRLTSSSIETDGFKAKKFPLKDLVFATEDFKAEYFLGEGGFGKVFKGRLQDTGQIAAIKQLDTNGCQGIREFVVEVLTLSNAEDPNLVKLIGYCAEGDQRLLIYEYMPLGSLDDHLHGPRGNRKLLDWNIRMKIVAGAARGLQYLHNKMNPPVIYRDLKCSNILLGEGYHPKLSDFGLAKVGPSGDQTHVSTRVMGTYGYCAPDYAMTGQLTFKSDIYSFGVVLLEIVTGRKAFDRSKSGPEQNIVEWAKPLFKDRKNFHQMVDPALEGKYPVRGLYQALAIAAMCIQEQPSMRPLIDDIVNSFDYLTSQIYDPNTQPVQQTTRRANSSRGHRRMGEESGANERRIRSGEN